jgi:glycosyltransferase involved in cell wall biosynthesis
MMLEAIPAMQDTQTDADPGLGVVESDCGICVVSIAHSAVTRGIARMRYWPIAARMGRRFTLVIPAQWHEYGNWIAAEPPEPELLIITLPAMLKKSGPAKWYLHFYPGLAKLLQKLRPDVIHLWEEPWSIVALQSILIRNAFLPESAIILETDQNILRKLPQPFEFFRRFALQRTDALIVRGPEALAVAKATGFDGPSVTVEYCFDRSNFHANGREEARHALGGFDGLVVGYVGRLTEEKGLAKVIAALAQCHAKISLLLLGDGPESSALKHQAKALGVAENVRFLPPRHYAEVAAFMRGIDVLILFSQTRSTWKEQFGRVIIEAQACGTPVIGSNSGAIPSIVQGGGWIVGEDETSELAVLLDRLAHDPEEIRVKSISGVEQAVKRFTPEKIAGDLANAYQIAITRRRQKSQG